jgi:hypothetical protein
MTHANIYNRAADSSTSRNAGYPMGYVQRQYSWFRKAWIRDTKELLYLETVTQTLRDPKTGRYVKKDKRT